MVDSAKPRATYDDLIAVPELFVAEILLGELVTHRRLPPRACYAASSLGPMLGQPFDRARGGPGGWLLFDQPELHLHDDVVVPNLCGWTRARMPVMPDVAAFTLPPDWVCEVLTPSTAGIDRVEKMQIYARERVTHVWHLDPSAQTLQVFRLDGVTYVLAGAWRGDAEVRAEPFDAVPLELGALWAR